MRRALPWLLSIAMLSSSLPAYADAYDAAMARAAAAKEKALDANDAASWEEALLRFREADAIRATKESKYEVATAAAWLKQDDIAVEAYQEALALGLSDPAKTKAEAFVADRQAKIAKLTVTGPAGARVLIDGRARGTLPRATPFVVFAGTIKVRVESGADAKEGSLETTAGAEAKFDGTPEKKVVPEPPPPPPVTPKPIPPAPVRDDGSRALGWTFLGTGTAVAVIGLGSTFIAMARVSTLQKDMDKYPCIENDGTYCTTLKPGTSEATKLEAQSTSNSLATWRGIRTAGIVTSIVGGVTAIAGGVILLGSKKEQQVGFTSLPGGGFLTLSGSF
jgi:hypothetical protein